ncbi:hypothetical protein HDV00_000100 [Rhizophlyctis rosea]|nr:hypothetical protein HDV00_000100 [Rhizophlyctis rosea]
MDMLANLNAELQEFEAFVEKYTFQMDATLSGKVKDDQLPDLADSNRAANVNTALPDQGESNSLASVPDEVNPVHHQQSEMIIHFPEKQISTPDIKPAAVKSRGIEYSKWESLSVVDRTNNETAPAAEHAKPVQPTLPPKKKQSRRETEIHDKARTHRLRGNTFFKEGKYQDAVEAYTAGIKVYLDTATSISFNTPSLPSSMTIPVDSALLTNRALANLRLESWQAAADDCSKALQIDCGIVKARWRRAEAYRGMREFKKAMEDIVTVQKQVEEFEGFRGTGDRNETVSSLGVTMTEVKKFQKLLEADITEQDAEDNVARELRNTGSQELLDSLVSTISDGLSHSPRDPSLRLACTTLTKLLAAEPSLSDGFRLSKGFDCLLSNNVLSPTTVHLVLPIMVAACRKSAVNRKEMARRVGDILGSLMGVDRPDVEVIGTGAELLSICAEEEVFVHALSRMAQPQAAPFGELLRMFIARDGGVVTSTHVTTHLLRFVGKVLVVKPQGVMTVTKLWDLSGDTLVKTLPMHISCAASKGSSEICLAACTCLTRVLDMHFATKSKAVTESIDRYVSSIFNTITHYPSQPSRTNVDTNGLLPALLAAFHNLLLHLSAPITTVLTTHNVIPTLLSLLPDQSTQPTIISTLAKLSKHHAEQMADALDGWWDEVPIRSIIQDFLNEKLGPTDIQGGAQPQRSGTCTSALQLLAIWLQRGKERSVTEWRGAGGFGLLTGLLKKCAESAQAMADEKVIGNAVLCVGECVRRAENAKTFAKLGIVDPLVFLLRRLKDSGAKRNLAIACARLCQVGQEEQRMKQDPVPEFKEDEIVLCYHGPLIYHAKVLKTEIKNGEIRYKVHYKGWSPKWDDWANSDRVLKLNDDNLKLAVQLEEEIAGKRSGKAGEKRRSLGTAGSAGMQEKLKHWQDVGRRKGKAVEKV